MPKTPPTSSKRDTAETRIRLRDDYKQLDTVVAQIIKTVIGYMHGIPRDKIRERITRAYHFAREAHEGDFRKSGEPYIIHPVLATQELLRLQPDLITIEATLLHDVPEDTDCTVEDIEKIF